MPEREATCLARLEVAGDCCESRAGRTADAIEHLRTAIEMWEDCRGMARDDSDFDPIRHLPAFQEFFRP
jgi:hypothetical protein